MSLPLALTTVPLAVPPAVRGLPAFFGGEVMLYVSALLAVWSTRRPAGGGPVPGRRAIAHSLPVAVVVVLAMVGGHSEIALGVIFGTSVAAMSGLVGFLGLVAPVGPGPARWRGVWPFAVAAALLAFLGGFGGLVTRTCAVALATEGLVLLALWRDISADPVPDSYAHATASAPPKSVPLTAEGLAHVLDGAARGADSTASQAPALEREEEKPVLTYSRDDRTQMPPWVRWVLCGLALALACVGAGAAIRGAAQFSLQGRHLSTGASAATLLSIALVLPMVYSGRGYAASRQTWVPMTTQVGFVLINLCVLLPFVGAFPYLASMMPQIQSSWGWPGIDWTPVRPPAQAVVYPLAVWRVDTVLLIILGLLYLPVAVGRWALGKEEAFVLIAGYCVYVTVVMSGGRG